MKKLLCILLIITCFTKVYSQKISFQGYLKDSMTHLPIAGGIITNVTTKKKISTNAKGYFQIEASPNDFIYVLANYYRYDTLTFSFLFNDTITIYLKPTGNILPTITVKSQYNRYQLDSLKRRAEFEAGRGTQLKAVSSSNSGGFGIGINLDRLLKKKYKNKKGGEKINETIEESKYVDYRFSLHVVAYYTGFKGDTLKSFMQLYTPTYLWLRAHPSNEDILYYINDKLKLFNE